MSTVCRICLVGNTSLNSVINKQLVSCYEKLTNAKFYSQDARPTAVCCFCYQKLLRCHTFSQLALRSEKVFNHLCDKDLEITQDNISEVNLNNKQCLSVGTMTFVTIDGNSTNAGSQVTIKDDPSIDMNEELSPEPDKLLKVESIPVKYCSKSLRTFEEDNSDREDDMEELLSTTHNEQSEPDDSSITIKDEPLPHIDIKKEMTTELDILEINWREPFPENSTRSRLTFEVDNSDQENDMQELLQKNYVEQTKQDHSKITFSCNNCNKIFYSKSKLISHIRNLHSYVKENKYSSPKKDTEISMIEDKSSHNHKNNIACHICDNTFVTKRNLKRHLRIHTGERSFACHICDKRFCHKHDLVTHLRTHTGEKPFACHDCDKKYSQKHNLVLHIMIRHTGEKLFSCYVCHKQFNCKSHLVSHKRTHTCEMRFACKVCDKQFIHKSHLVSHERTHTGGKPFACHVCENRFSEKSSLDKHMGIYRGGSQFYCHVCDKKFHCENHLVSHKRTHTGEKPYACKVCEKKFNLKSRLISHEITHTDEKPFACEVCDKQFNQKGNLVSHKRTHTGEKQFACEVCDKQFNHKGNLDTHIKTTHTDEKRFPCEVCDKKFYHKYSLVNHIRKHTGEKPFACNVCGKQCYRKDGLVSHMKTHASQKHPKPASTPGSGRRRQLPSNRR